jgi:hypothetical protein
MDKKDDVVAELEKEVIRLREKEKKREEEDRHKNARERLKKRLDDSYVLKNEGQFIQLLEVLQMFKTSTGERYFHTRKARKGSTDAGKEQSVFKLNLLIEDLLEFKARTNVEPKDLPVRLSMDRGALIDFLQVGRAQRKSTRTRTLTKKEKKAVVEQSKEVKEVWVRRENLDGQQEILPDQKLKDPPEAFAEKVLSPEPPGQLPDIDSAPIQVNPPPEPPAVSNFEIEDKDSPPAKKKRSRPSFGED